VAEDQKEPRLETWALGLLGVNVVDSPIHLQDGELLTAQNAEPFTEEGEGGLRKRLGIGELGSAIGTPLYAVTNIPLPDPAPTLDVTGTRIYAPTQQDGTDSHWASDDGGFSWGLVNEPPPRWLVGTQISGGNYAFCRGGACSSDGLLTIVKESDPLTVYEWDGTTLTTRPGTYTLTGAETLVAVAMHLGEIFALTANGGGPSWTLLKHDGTAWSTVASLAGTTYLGASLLSAYGQLWIGTSNNRVYSVDPTDGTVTLDEEFAPLFPVHISGLALYQGLIYATGGSGTASLIGTHKVLKRASDGTWSDITPGSALTGDYGSPAIFGSELYVARSARGGFAGAEIWRYNAATWTRDADLATLFSGVNYCGVLMAFNGVLLAMPAGTVEPKVRILLTTGNGTWTSVLDVNTVVHPTQSMPGTMGFY
jgi:hypothetical protein